MLRVLISAWQQAAIRGVDMAGVRGAKRVTAIIAAAKSYQGAVQRFHKADTAVVGETHPAAGRHLKSMMSAAKKLSALGVHASEGRMSMMGSGRSLHSVLKRHARRRDRRGRFA